MRGGQIIKEARLRAGISQEQLAKRLGTKQSVVARWETGATSPSFETVVRVVRSCGFDLYFSMANYDDQDDRLVDDHLRMSPKQRIAALRNMLEVERTLQGARPVS
jgi:transcriptional regulator with XRE-family HTH domain